MEVIRLEDTLKQTSTDQQEYENQFALILQLSTPLQPIIKSPSR
jgi:hypothetical protein